MAMRIKVFVKKWPLSYDLTVLCFEVDNYLRKEKSDFSFSTNMHFIDTGTQIMMKNGDW
jgi:hypothetical protein